MPVDDRWEFEGWMIGPRLRLEDHRAGSGSIVLDRNGSRWPASGHDWMDDTGLVKIPMMLAGAIGRWSTTYPATGQVRFSAACSCCGAMSKPYVKRREVAMRVWAQRHRCGIFAKPLVSEPGVRP